MKSNCTEVRAKLEVKNSREIARKISGWVNERKRMTGTTLDAKRKEWTKRPSKKCLAAWHECLGIS